MTTKTVTQTTHTPGPWVTGEYNEKSYIEAVDGGMVVIVGCIYQNPKREANARLIVAAPDLLAACEAIMDAFVHVEGDIKGNKARTDIFRQCVNMRRAVDSARIAIEQATERTYVHFEATTN